MTGDRGTQQYTGHDSRRRAGDEQPIGDRSRKYSQPRLTCIGSEDTLLDILGPAQANYGPPGMP